MVKRGETFASLAGESIVMIPRCFVTTHHAQLVLTSALGPQSHPRPPPQGQPHHSVALNRDVAGGLRGGVAGGLQAVGAVVVRQVIWLG